MYNQGDNYHYCWIKNFDRLVSKQYNKDNNKYYHCKRCLHGFKIKETLEQHGENCITEPTRIKMPSEKDKYIKFEKIQHHLKVPFVICADFESLTLPISSAHNNNNESYTEAYQHHEPCGFAYKAVSFDNHYTKPLCLYRGKKMF